MSERPDLAHRLTPMSGRDRNEQDRSSTPLEALFDLTFVIAIATAASQAAQYAAADRWLAVLGGFAFAIFAIIWAWINFTWFASAFDTDDWLYRVTTMVQMVGVIVLAIGIPDTFASISRDGPLDNRVVVIGYVIMRVAMVGQWLRAAHDSPEFRRTCLRYATTIAILQVYWVIQAFMDFPRTVGFVLIGIGPILEMAIPMWAERHGRSRTPWHPDHIAERYSLMAIIVLGEGITGSVLSSQGALAGDRRHWSIDAILVLIAGVGLTFTLWWNYFLTEWGRMLRNRTTKAFGFGYIHIAIFGSVAAVGTGLQVAGLALENHTDMPNWQVVMMTALPVWSFVVTTFLMYTYLTGELDGLHWLLTGWCTLVCAAAVVLGVCGVSIPVCLLVVLVAPTGIVIIFESFGHTRQEAVLCRIEAAADAAGAEQSD